MLIGQKLHHNSFGDCIVQEVKIDEDDFFDSCIVLLLEHHKESITIGRSNIKKINIRAFNGQIIEEITVPTEMTPELLQIEKRISNLKLDLKPISSFFQKQNGKQNSNEMIIEEQIKKEELEFNKLKIIELEAWISEDKPRNEFKLLKEKYQVGNFIETSPISELNKILINLDENNHLGKVEEQWLKEKHLYPVLAIHYERTGNISAAGSQWRKANNPERALMISNNLPSYDHYILTMRGGAYRDLNTLEKAKECALLAIKLNPEGFYAYNLMGAILFQQGLAEEGEKYFQQASLLGSKPYDEDSNIRSALKNAGISEKIRVADYLIKKDPNRYEWAKAYL